MATQAKRQEQAKHGMKQSSIALLQTRFQQLQRAKEMRQKKSQHIQILFSPHNFKNNTICSTPALSTNIKPHDDQHHHHHKLQASIPFNCDFNYNTHHKPTSCYSSSSSPSSSSISESAHHHHSTSAEEVSLSLWPSMSIPCYEANYSTVDNFRPTSLSKKTKSTTFNFDDPNDSHVDTTLHL